MTETESSEGRPGKVEKLLQKYDLPTLGEEIRTRWAGDDDDERLGLRPLARFLNIEIVDAALENAGVDTIKGEADNYYDKLANENVSSGVKTEIERSLEGYGIDVDELRSDFVSRQAIQTYLEKAGDVDRAEPTSEQTTEGIRSTIDRLRQRTARVTESKVRRLADRGDLEVGQFRVIVDVQVYCADCGRQYPIRDLITRGSCDCSG